MSYDILRENFISSKTEAKTKQKLKVRVFPMSHVRTVRASPGPAAFGLFAQVTQYKYNGPKYNPLLPGRSCKE